MALLRPQYACILAISQALIRHAAYFDITDVITLMGYYTSVSMTLAFYDVPAGASGIVR
jgi:4-carboxymuconolactone decarboxylase